MTIVVPIVTVPEANRRDHWAVKGKRARAQRHAVALMFKMARVPKAERYAITLTRVCPGRNQVRDRDNLASSLKAVRDEVAAQLGINDADLTDAAQAQWEYRQIAEPRRDAVIIEVKVAK